MRRIIYLIALCALRLWFWQYYYGERIARRFNVSLLRPTTGRGARIAHRIYHRWVRRWLLRQLAEDLRNEVFGSRTYSMPGNLIYDPKVGMIESTASSPVGNIADMFSGAKAKEN